MCCVDAAMGLDTNEAVRSLGPTSSTQVPLSVQLRPTRLWAWTRGGSVWVTSCTSTRA